MPKEKLFPLNWTSLNPKDIKEKFEEFNIVTEQDLNEAIRKAQEALNPSVIKSKS